LFDYESCLLALCVTLSINSSFSDGPQMRIKLRNVPSIEQWQAIDVITSKNSKQTNVKAEEGPCNPNDKKKAHAKHQPTMAVKFLMQYQ